MHNELYKSTSVTLAVFRMLPELAQVYISRWLLVNERVTKNAFAAWRKDPDDSQNAQAIFALRAMHILRERTDDMELQVNFRGSLTKAISGR